MCPVWGPILSEASSGHLAEGAPILLARGRHIPIFFFSEYILVSVVIFFLYLLVCSLSERFPEYMLCARQCSSPWVYRGEQISSSPGAYSLVMIVVVRRQIITRISK